jgi:hypothetical protein
MRLPRRKIILIISLCFLIIPPVYFIVINYLPDSERTIPIVLSYPETPDVNLGFSGNQSYFSIVFQLSTQGYLAENVQIQIVNASCLSYIHKNMTVGVIFPNAVDYRLKQALSSGSGIMGNNQIHFLIFRDNTVKTQNENIVTDIHLVEPSEISEIYFPVSGDYSPTVRIFIEGQPEIVYAFNQIKVHVLSASELEGIKIGRANNGLSYALFWLTILGTVWLLRDLFKKKERKHVLKNNMRFHPKTSWFNQLKANRKKKS